jgi:hypothetical protein
MTYVLTALQGEKILSMSENDPSVILDGIKHKGFNP